MEKEKTDAEKRLTDWKKLSNFVESLTQLESSLLVNVLKKELIKNGWKDFDISSEFEDEQESINEKFFKNIFPKISASDLNKKD